MMITVANRTETAARIKYAFDHKKVHIDELADPAAHAPYRFQSAGGGRGGRGADRADVETERTDESEEAEDDTAKRKLTKKQQAELLRRQVDTVGQVGKPGEQIQSVISVGMLSEGWDAKTVTHIMGLRAFTSQLLCEQVVGRGLRRTAYELNPETGLFDPEYVNIFGVPFTFLPHESEEGTIPAPPKPKTAIEPDPAKASCEISWPNVIRIDHVYRPRLSLDWSKVKPLELNASQTAKLAELAPILEGKPDVTKVAQIDLERLAREFRTQKIIFEAARDVYEQMQKDWKGSKESLLAQLVRLVEQFIRSDKITVIPALFTQDDLKRRLIITLNMTKVVQHIWEAIRFENAEKLEPVFDRDRPIRSTGDMGTWYTGKPCERTDRSHINFCVYDSTWEASEAFELDHNPDVDAWVKNDHLGLKSSMSIRASSGNTGRISWSGSSPATSWCWRQRARHGTGQRKREFLGEWVKAVNGHGGFGHWSWDVSLNPGISRTSWRTTRNPKRPNPSRSVAFRPSPILMIY